MSILDTIKTQKTHVIYLTIMIVLAALSYNFLVKRPATHTVTVVQTKQQDRNIVKTRVQYIDRVIVKKETDGTSVTTTEHITNDNTFVDKTKSKSSFASSDKTTYLSRYSLGINYPFGVTPTTFNPNFNYKLVNIEGGMRVFNSPVFVTLGTNLQFNTINLGFRIEF